MILSNYLSRMEGDKSDPHEVIPISYNSHSILKEHYYTLFNLPSETYRLVTRSQTKSGGTQLLKVHRVDKVVYPAFKHENQARRERISKPIQVESKIMSQPQRRVPPVIPRKGKGRAGAGGNLLNPDCNIYHNNSLSLLPYSTLYTSTSNFNAIYIHATLRRKTPSKTL